MASSSRLPALLLGLVLGAGTGFFAAYQRYYKPPGVQHEMHIAESPFDETPELMLFPQGFTLDANVRNPAMLRAMLDPDQIRIHAADEGGSLVVSNWKFSADGATPDKDTADRLKWALGSVSSYEPAGKLCIFHPDILLRLEKDGQTHDIVFCFTCSQTTAGLDLSIQGKRTFLKCFCDTLPGFTRLHNVRKRFETGR